jgi:UDPglucose 6-dehydrogenase
LKAGIGWGGSCFPKDVAALDQMAGASGYDFRLLEAVIAVNRNQRSHFIDKVAQYFAGNIAGKRFAVFGLAFKDNTDDVRESAAIDIIQQLIDHQAVVTAFDYQATDNARRILPAIVEYATDPYTAAKQADAILLVTEWKEFQELDWARLKTMLVQPLVFDGRNLLKPNMMRELGFEYHSIGRPAHPA